MQQAAAPASSTDWPTVLAVTGAMITALTASGFAWRFSRRVGGEMGQAFKFVVFGVIVFALTRVDDAFKTAGLIAAWGIDYKEVFWLPHHIFVLIGWSFI